MKELKSLVEDCQGLLDDAKDYLDQGDKWVPWGDLDYMCDLIRDNTPERIAELLKMGKDGVYEPGDLSEEG